MRSNKVAVVLVNYQQPMLTVDCVRSLRNMSNGQWIGIIVDNASEDASWEILQKECGDCELLFSKVNGGFAAGCNLGIQKGLELGAEYILLLNNDTEVDPEMLDILLEHADEDTVTVPKMYYYQEPQRIWYAGGYIDRKKGTVFHYGEGETDHGQYDLYRKIDFATGCCMLISRKIIETVGEMDESYFLYFEDADYSASIIKRGYSILYCPEAQLWHKVSATTGKNSMLMEYYVNRNRLYFIHKFKLPISAQIYTYVSRFVKMTRGFLLHGNERIILRSFQDYFRGRTGA